MNKFLIVLIEWAVTTFIVPFIKKFKDAAKLLEIKKKADKAAKDLENAQSDSDIDRSIDNLP